MRSRSDAATVVCVSPGHGFSGIARTRLLNILQRRAEALGVQLEFGIEVGPRDVQRWMAEHDLVVAADGANSGVRSALAETFRPRIDLRHNKYAWFGTTLPFEHFLFSFRETPYGLFWCHAYRYDASHSTFIVECDPDNVAGCRSRQLLGSRKRRLLRERVRARICTATGC